jgi:hypothetical protein
MHSKVHTSHGAKQWFHKPPWASMPRAIMTGTVIKDVLPVTTLIALVKKNTAIKRESLTPDTRP